jgi:hypothetical protein
MTRDGWNPRPVPDGTKFNDAAYLCGYTDGFFGEAFGAHDKGKYGAFSAYRPGFSDGRADAKIRPCEVCGALPGQGHAYEQCVLDGEEGK